MTDSSIDNTGPFTMVYHLMAQEVGLVCAAVYGEVKRRCSLQAGVCNASLDTIGGAINLDRATVMRSIKKLCELGYLTDQTPGRRNAPHTYILAKSVAQCNSSNDTGVVIRNSPGGETVADDNKSVAYNNSSMESVAENNATVAESHLNRVLEKETPNGVGKKLPEGKTNQQGPRWQLRNEFVTLSGIPWPDNKADSDYWWSRIGALFEIALRDVDVGKRLIRDSIDKLRAEELTISDPGSLVKIARALKVKPKTKVSAF